jgi:hypothetical protein
MLRLRWVQLVWLIGDQKAGGLFFFCGQSMEHMSGLWGSVRLEDVKVSLEILGLTKQQARAAVGARLSPTWSSVLDAD